MEPAEATVAELPLKRVVLSTAGLGQFTHFGEAEAGSTIALSVRLDQVDDLLKSLTIFDREGGVGAVSLPGKAPLAELFRDLPFDIEDLQSPQALLNALVGAEIEIEGQVKARGRVFRVVEERVSLPDKAGHTIRHRLSLLTDRGLVQAVLEDLTALRFADPLVRSQVEHALAGVAENRAKERRTLSIGLTGEGARTVGFSYVIATPVWKIAYRLVLPREGDAAQASERARLQGWAVVENLTGSDWNDIELSLTSGDPVALKQPLYTAFFRDRPEIPVAAAKRVLPRQDDADDADLEFCAEEPAYSGVIVGAAAPAHARAMPDEFAKMSKSRGPSTLEEESRKEGFGAETLGGVALAAESEEASSQVSYRFPAPLSLGAGGTMMIPVVDGEIAASRVWLFQPETNARRPLAAVRLRNDSGAALPAGLITAYDTAADGNASFVGDAQLPLLPKGEAKFVIFALDSKTAVRREDRGVKRTNLGKAVNGKLTIAIKSHWRIEYEITPPAEEDREIVIDEARADGWKPAPEMTGVELTASRLRFTIKAPKGGTTKAVLHLECLDHRSVTLSSLGPRDLLSRFEGLENESPALEAAIASTGELVARVNKAEARRRELETERKKIAEDQGRVRKNLESVGQSSDLGRRYLDTLKQQEDRLDAIGVEADALSAELIRARTSAEELANALTL